ncbi:uncharacterized protein K02A2.6-like [Mercenaria mercenaria]|uniref:uncharacterized protein K02A2.6-like n=1 Tax=Mercenaria mercenaria TaxID=6596 RepID=UPI00234E5A30|nr:uncharacterized protein K02A2.6-like [Mercenaria mercenaria]
MNTSYKEDVDFVSFITDIPLNAKDIADATRKNPILSKVCEYTLNGWPKYVNDPDLKPYFIRRNELSVDNGVILWGLRVVIPEPYREQLLSELHEKHMGMCKMKALARSYLWWNNIDSDIERTVKGCATCMSVQNSPATAPLHPLKWATRPWQRIHIDYAEFKQQIFLVVTASYSKWLEVIPMKSTTSEKTIEKLRGLFSTWGLPEELVSDNDPRFTSAEFHMFMKNNGIRHTLVPSYHLSSNGAFERAIQVLKKSLKKQLFEARNNGKNNTLHYRLSNFLLRYRNTPHSITKEFPAVLFLKRQLRSRLTLLKPNKELDIEQKQEKMASSHDRNRSIMRHFFEGDTVLVKTTLPGGKKWKWLPGTVTKQKGPVTYLVKVGPKIRYCHIDHLRKNEANFPQEDENLNSGIPFILPTGLHISGSKKRENISDSGHSNLKPEIPSESGSESRPEGQSLIGNETEITRRYPTHERKPPNRLNL